MKNIFWAAFILLVTATACREVFGKRIRGNGHLQTESRPASDFHSIDVSGAIDVYVKQGSGYSVQVVTDENLLPYVVVYNNKGTLQIHESDGVNLKPSRGIKVYVSSPQYKRFEASGACNIYSENKIISPQSIDIDLSGASDVKMEVKSPGIRAELSGAGTIALKGETKDFSVDGSGSTAIKCFDLLAENVAVEISGAGDADVFASVQLDVHVSGAGSVRYRGNAAVNQRISGAGSVKKIAE